MSETIVKITGMTCGHCEGRVSAELGKLEGVSEVKASAADAQAVITSSGALDADAISRAVVAAGYRVSAQVCTNHFWSYTPSGHACQPLVVIPVRRSVAVLTLTFI